MAVTPLSYTLKDPAIELVKFDTSSVETMEDVRDWVIANLPQDHTVTLQTAMGGSLFWSGPGTSPTGLFAGNYVAKDTNGKLFKLTQELVDAFYDQVV